ncbi:DUF2267 domain-containing protein [Streptomyces sp. NPDC086766]|uniref:DUF2267 domain-containing protein n=1 Tax=Streptomyces sp. NPDC086766 TaxID=3365754 RepID=UPI0037FFDF0C
MTATTVPSVTVPRVTVPGPPQTGAARQGEQPLKALLTTQTRSRRPAGHDAVATWRDLTERVRSAGQYPERAEAERITRIVLSTLGGHVVGDERVELAQALPEEAASVIAAQIPVARPLTAAQFVDSVAGRIAGATPATARWHTGSVLSVLAALLPDDLLTRILADLPPGYALLFGRAELGLASREKSMPT